jgi:membrane protein DedA with SNARE-associated domain
VRRIVLLSVAIAAFFLASFAACHFLGILTDESLRAWLSKLPPGAALAAVAALLASDLILPIPSSVVLSAGGASGAGWLAVAAAGSVGMIAGNVIGYWACRLLGEKAFRRFVKPEEAERFGKWLDRWGAPAMVISRLVPMMAETLSCLAGAGRMGFPRFLAALVVGTVPMAAFFAFWGEKGQNVVVVSLAVPAAAWLAFAMFSRRAP